MPYRFPLEWTHLIWLVLVFMAGAAYGSFINVVAGRLPFEKTVIWPSSRCMTCLNKLWFVDNLPIVGYLMRRGTCRFCGTRFSSRYLWIEVLTGLLFAAVFYFDVCVNWFRHEAIAQAVGEINQGLTPWRGWLMFLHHVVLVSFLLAAALCDLDTRTIPFSITVTGTVVGLVFAMMMPWPFPNDRSLVLNLPKENSWAFGLPPERLINGSYPWPVFGPVPDVFHSYPVIQGLVTGLAGALMGMLLIRLVKFMFEMGLGKEAIGLGDADILMMAGAFVGWQIVFVSFFVGAILSLPIGVLLLFRGKGRSLPFGPGLAAGVVVTLYAWPHLGPLLQTYFFDGFLMAVMGVVVGGGMFVASIGLRLLGFGK